MAQDNNPDGTLLDSLLADQPETTGAPDVSFDDGGLLDSFLNEGVVAPVQAQATAPSPDTQFLDGLLQSDAEYQGLLASGDSPTDDTVYEAGLGNALGTGLVGLYDSTVRTPAKLLNDAFLSVAEEYAPGSAFESWAKETAGRQAKEDGIIEEYNRQRPASATMQKIGADANTFEEGWDAFMESEEKWTVVKELAGGTIPGTLTLAGGYAAGGLKAVFKLSTMMSFGDDYQESLKQGKSKDEALVAALIKSPIQGAFDMASFAFPAKVKLANGYADAIAQTLMQGVLGGGAEAGKHVAVGEEFSGGRVLLEAGGELLGAPVDVATARRGVNPNKMDARRKEVADKLRGDLQELADESGLKGKKKQVESLVKGLTDNLEAVAGETVGLAKTGIDLQKGETAQGVLERVVTGEGVEDIVSNEIEATLEVKDGEGTTKLGLFNWEGKNVAVGVETFWTEKAQAARVAVERLKSLLSSQEVLQDPNVTPEETVALQEKLSAREEEAAIAEDNAKRETDFTTRAGELINTWVETFNPGMKVVVTPGSAGSIVSSNAVAALELRRERALLEYEVSNPIGENPTEAELQTRAVEIRKIKAGFKANLTTARSYNFKSKEGKSTKGLNYRLTNGVQVVDLNSENLFNDLGVTKQGDFAEVVAHEFGHALLNETFLQADQKVREALTKGYRKWLKKLMKAASVSEKEFWRVHGGIVRASQSENESPWTSPNPYWYSMNEYLANQMTKSIGNNKLVGTVVEKFFAKAKALLQKLFNSVKDAIPEQSFTDFINLLAAKKTLAELNAAEAEGNVDTIEKVVEKARVQIGNILNSSKLVPPKGFGKNKRDGRYGEEEFQSDLDKYNGVLKWGVTLLQIGKLNQHIPGLQKYVGLIKEWWNEKMRQTARADERLQQWNSLKPKDSKNLGRFMQELTVKSYENGERYGSDSKVWEKLVEKYEMTGEMLALADLIEQDFTSVLEELEAVQVENANNIEDELERAREIEEISKGFEALRERNFFPLSRFGDWFTRIAAKRDMIYDGVEYKAGQTITFETFESQAGMKKRQGVFGNKEKYLVDGGLMDDTQKQFAGFPPQLLTMLKKNFQLTAAQREVMSPDAVELAEQQDAALTQLIKDLAPGKSFTKHMMTRKNTPGFSTDAVRSYANYFLHFGNYVARIKYKGKLLGAIEEVGDSAKVIGKRTGDNSKRMQIKKYMAEHYEKAMNPGDELANLRAIGFLWYLGFVPKSAFVNLTQVPLVTYPFLAARYGDVGAVAALARASKDAAKYWTNPKAMKQGQMDMIYELIQSGILDESMATELAAASEGSILNRVTPGEVLGSEKAARVVRRMAGAGAWMFQKAEKMNRRVTALAAYDLALQSGMNQEQAVEAARDTVESTQYEYARWNRPRFSQGKKSVMFLFWQYLQNSLFFLATDPGRMRYVAMMFLFAGLSGIPGAEDAMDLYDFIMKKLNKRFGEDFSDVNIRKDAQLFIKQLGMNPDLVMHGSSRYSFGMSALGDMVGLPIPNVDMSGSLSMGSVIPGFGELLSDGRFDQNLGKAAEAIGGAVVAMPIQLMRAIADDNPDTLKKFERAMPSFAKHMSKAYRYASRGEETLPDGTVITKFNLDDSKQKAEILLQGLGFNSTRVADAKVPIYMTKEILQYYSIRRSSLVNLLDYAKRSKDSKMWGKTWLEVRRFNKALQGKGLGTMVIKPGNVRRSLKDRKKQRLMQERGIVGGKLGAQVSREVFDAFPDEEEVP